MTAAFTSAIEVLPQILPHIVAKADIVEGTSGYDASVDGGSTVKNRKT